MADDPKPLEEEDETESEEGEEIEGGEGDEPEPLEAEEPEGEEPEGEDLPQKSSRGANLRHRAQEAERLAQEEREARIRAEAERDALRSGRQPQSTAEDEAIERERLALMNPDERVDHLVRRSETRLRGEFRQSQMALADQADKNGFEAKAAVNPIYRKYQSRVEATLEKIRAQARANGGGPVNVPREALLDMEIGKDIRTKAQDAGTKQRKRAAEARERETVRPAGNKSDAGAARKKTGKTARERLDDVTF